MKNIFTLLLVLLIPSLSFGRSAYIYIFNDDDTDIQNIVIMDSQIGKKQIFNLKIRKGIILLSDNIVELTKLRKTMFELCRSNSFYFPNNQKSFLYSLTDEFFLQNAVYANWQVTSLVKGSKEISIFLYKQDK